MTLLTTVATFPRLDLLWSCDIHAAIKYKPKYLTHPSIKRKYIAAWWQPHQYVCACTILLMCVDESRKFLFQTAWTLIVKRKKVWSKSLKLGTCLNYCPDAFLPMPKCLWLDIIRCILFIILWIISTCMSIFVISRSNASVGTFPGLFTVTQSNVVKYCHYSMADSHYCLFRCLCLGNQSFQTKLYFWKFSYDE